MMLECRKCGTSIDVGFNEMEDVEEKYLFKQLHQEKACYLVWRVPATDKRASVSSERVGDILDSEIIE